MSSALEWALHAGGALNVAPGDEACLRVRPLRPVRLLAALPGLPDPLVLQ